MAWWKKALIGFGIFIVVFGLGFGTAGIIFGSTTADLRERVKLITQQYETASIAQREAEATVDRLGKQLEDSNKTIEGLTDRLRLAYTEAERLRGRVESLEGTINAISEGIGGATATATESERLIQESLRILLGISKRDRETDQ